MASPVAAERSAQTRGKQPMTQAGHGTAVTRGAAPDPGRLPAEAPPICQLGLGCRGCTADRGEASRPTHPERANQGHGPKHPAGRSGRPLSPLSPGVSPITSDYNHISNHNVIQISLFGFLVGPFQSLTGRRAQKLQRHEGKSPASSPPAGTPPLPRLAAAQGTRGRPRGTKPRVGICAIHTFSFKKENALAICLEYFLY